MKKLDAAGYVLEGAGKLGAKRMARCSVCKGHAVATCAECGAQVCMSHSTTIFDETSRVMKTFCGNCTAKRMPVWSYHRRR